MVFRFSAVLLLMVFTASAFAQQARGGTVTNQTPVTEGVTRAVVVGISKYQEVRPQLEFADKDAMAFAAYLQSKSGGAVPQENIRLLTNEDATTANIISALEWLKQMSKEGDRAIFYFSGHGDVETLTGAQNGYLLTYNSPKLVYIAGALPVFIVKDYINTLSQNKVNAVLISDACHSGKLAGGIEGMKAAGSALLNQWSREVKILSAQPDQVSLESTQWGNGRGVFSFYLINGLYGLADANHDGQVAMSELENYVSENVLRDSKQQQQPIFEGSAKYTTMMGHPDAAEMAAVEAATTGGSEVAMKGVNGKGVWHPDRAAQQLNEVQQVINQYLEGKNFVRKEDFRTAYEKMNAAMAGFDPSHPLYPTLHAKALFLQAAATSDLFSDSKLAGKDYRQAILLLDSALRLLPEAAYIYQMRAEMYHQLADDDHTEQDLLKAHELSPKWIAPIFTLALLHQAKGELHQAKDDLEMALSLDSTLHMLECTKCTFNMLGDIYRDSKKPDKALENYRKAIQLDADFIQPYGSATDLLCRQKKFDEARTLVAPLMQHDSVEGLYYLASIAIAQKLYDDAATYLDEALSVTDTEASVYNLYGFLYEQQGDEDGAEESYRQAADLDPDYTVNIESLVNLLYRMGEDDSVESFLAEVLPRTTTTDAKMIVSYYQLQQYAYRWVGQGKHLTAADKAALLSKVKAAVTIIQQSELLKPDELKKVLGPLAKEPQVAGWMAKQ